MAPTTAHRKAWVLCTSATHLNFKAPKKELLYEAGLLAHYCKHSVRDKTNLKAVDTRTPTHLLASLSYWIYWRTDRQKCWSAFPAHAVQFPANSSHVCCVELALKGVLCTCLGRKGPLNTWALIRVNSFLWLPRPWWYGCAHALGTGRASFQFFFSISLKFRSRRKVFLDRSSRKRNEELLVYFNVFKTPVSKRMFREFV